MKITSLRSFGVAGSPADWTYVRVETDQPGLFGWGECSLPGKTHGVQGAMRNLEKLVVGWDPCDTNMCGNAYTATATGAAGFTARY